MKKLRVSYTLLNLWRQGKVQEAISCYFHMPMVSTPAMKKGKKVHKIIEEMIQSDGVLPDFLPKFKLVKPQAEKEVVVSYNDQFDLKCIIDCLDEPNLYDWKVGVTSALEWSGTLQLPLYFFICQLAGIEVDKGYIVRYNPIERKTDWVLIHNTPKMREYGENLVASLAPEILAFFEQEGLI